MTVLEQLVLVKAFLEDSVALKEVDSLEAMVRSILELKVLGDWTMFLKFFLVGILHLLAPSLVAAVLVAAKAWILRLR